MATFELSKETSDLQEPILLPEDWYSFEITEEVTQEKNAKWKEGGIELPAKEIPGAGENLVIRGRIISDEPEYSGRRFTKWLALPNPSDEGRYTNSGQPMEDWKLTQIYNWVRGFGGDVEGTQISFAIGMRTSIYITQELDRAGTLANTIGFTDPRPLSEKGEELPF